MKRLALVVGARPNYFKAMPVLRLLDAKSDVQAILVHTGQHYDPRLYEELFVEIGLRKPDVYLGIEDRSRRPTVAEMISSCDSWCRAVRPDAVVVCGDVDSTAACALAAHYAGIPVAHVEAGLRSGDREMPEEINRMVTDAVSRLLLVSDPAGVENLRREGRNDREIRLVGNVMIDTLVDRLPVARRCGFDEPVQERVDAGPFALLTLHRPANVDDPERLAAWLRAFARVGERIPLVWPLHPRTLRALERYRLLELADAIPNLVRTPPLGYLQTIALEERASLVLSDSAGIAEETSVLGTPCLVLRDSTERPITLSHGTARLVGKESSRLLEFVEEELGRGPPSVPEIPLWDGCAAQRVVEALEDLTTKVRS